MKKQTFSLSRFLYRVGEKIRFYPDGALAPLPSEKEEGASPRFSLLPYRRKVKSSLAKMTEQSVLLSRIRQGIHRFLTTRIRSFSVLFFSCGFVQIIAFFLNSYVSIGSGREDNLLFGVAQIFLTLFCSFARGTVADGVKKSFLYRGLLEPLVGLPDWSLPTGKNRDSLMVMVFTGTLLGVVSDFVGPLAVAKFFFSLVALFFVFAFPEAGFVCVGAGILFFSRTALLFWVGVTLISFLCKCAVGKRSLVASPMTAAVVFALFPLLFRRETGGFPVFFLCFSLYYLSLSLIRTGRGLDRFFAAVSMFGFVSASLLILRVGLEFLLPTIFFRAPDLVRILFLEPTAEIGIFFASLCPLVIGHFSRSVALGKKIFPAVTFLLFLICFALVQNGSVWLCALLGMVVYALFCYRSALLFFCVSGLSCILALQWIPPALSRRLFDLLGVGASFSHREQTGGLVEVFFRQGGAVSAFCLIVILALFVWECIRYAKGVSYSPRHSLVLSALSSAVVFVLASLQGTSPDERWLCLFFVLMAIPEAARKAALREEIRLPY